MSFFKEGDRVEMTEKAIQQGLNHGNRLYKATTRGTVLEDQVGSLILVVRDGRHSKHSYHASFWNLAR